MISYLFYFVNILCLPEISGFTRPLCLFGRLYNFKWCAKKKISDFSVLKNIFLPR